jgi:hypothetical protein
MDNQNLIGQLIGIRSTLLHATQSAAGLERKLTGPRPEKPSEVSPPPDSVTLLVVEIGVLSQQLLKMLAVQHGIVGEISGTASASARSYA